MRLFWIRNDNCRGLAMGHLFHVIREVGPGA